MDAFPQEKHYTYADYLTWDEKIRCELIDGVVYMLAAPAWEHQSVSGELYGQLWQFLKGKPCRVFSAPFDVRLNADGRDDTVVQPDLVVICDRSKIKGTGCVGAPDMVVEILSPSTAAKDKVRKFNKYWEAGVREYWLVNPDHKTATVHVLKNGEYTTREYEETDVVKVHVLDGCEIVLSDLFLE